MTTKGLPATAAVVAAALFASGLQAAHSEAERAADPAATALELRSEALNRLYEPAWLRALRIRSEALNRLYGARVRHA
jgi:hypothetical protein